MLFTEEVLGGLQKLQAGDHARQCFHCTCHTAIEVKDERGWKKMQCQVCGFESMTMRQLDYNHLIQSDKKR